MLGRSRLIRMRSASGLCNVDGLPFFGRRTGSLTKVYTAPK